MLILLVVASPLGIGRCKYEVVETTACATAPIQHVSHSAMTKRNPDACYDGCYGSSWYPGNVACTPDAADADLRCPTACAVAAAAPHTATRVRRALHTLSDEEWQRVVAALRVLATVGTAEGQALYGAQYREYNFFVLRHILAGNQAVHGTVCMGSHCASDAEADVVDSTGGGPQQLLWHSLMTFEVETSLLLVDPSIGGMPYLDWGAAVEPSWWDATFGKPSCTQPGDLAADDGGFGAGSGCVVDAGPFAWWPVTTDPFLLSSWLSANPDAAEAALVALLGDADADAALGRMASGGMRDETIAGRPEPYLLRAGAFDVAITSTVQAAERQDMVDFCLSEALTAEGGMFLELASCYESRLLTNLTHDLHKEYHAAFEASSRRRRRRKQRLRRRRLASGRRRTQRLDEAGEETWLQNRGHKADLSGGNSAILDPFFLFHHAGGDRLLRQWQHRNPQLRAISYGYPALSAYNFTPSALHDCVGCAAFNLSFTYDVEGGAALGSDDATTAGVAAAARRLTYGDVLCGDVADLVTYDVILAEADAAAADAAVAAGYTLLLRPAQLGVGGAVAVGLLIVGAVESLLCLRRLRVARRRGGASHSGPRLPMPPFTPLSMRPAGARQLRTVDADEREPRGWDVRPNEAVLSQWAYKLPL